MLEIDRQPNYRYMARLWARYELLKTEKLNLDMTRGKPCAEQLALSAPMLQDATTHTKSGLDCRNYGALEGIPEARKLCARYLGTDPKNTLVLGNSSLQLMHDVIVQMLLRGGLPKSPAFICPVPGYDRHFKICEMYDIRMLTVPLLEDGPDMRAVRTVVRNPDVVGMWCMPKYSNPTGATYSRAKVRELMRLKTANPRFMYMWDKAYEQHHLSSIKNTSDDVMLLAREANTEDRVWVFGSFSKVTFASAGLAMMASSKRNIDWFKQKLSAQTIGPDKLNQLRHVRFLRDLTGIKRHMAKHRRIIVPKFQAVYEELENGIGGKGIADWTKPDGGYFISLEMREGSAARVVQLAESLGVKLTSAGAAFPRGSDPRDEHIRIAPTFPSVEEVRRAAHVLALCAELAHREANPQTRSFKR